MRGESNERRSHLKCSMKGLQNIHMFAHKYIVYAMIGVANLVTPFYHVHLKDVQVKFALHRHVTYLNPESPENTNSQVCKQDSYTQDCY